MNLANKPSLTIRTVRIVEELMAQEDIALGSAIENILQSSPLYHEIAKKINKDIEDFCDGMDNHIP